MLSSLLQGFGQTYYTYNTNTPTHSSSSLGAGFWIGYTIFAVVFLAIVIASLWKTFQKAGYPGWASIVPFYNTYILLKIVNRPIWWIILFFIPVVNIVVEIIVYYDLARSFGKGAGFTVLMLLLPFIGFPMLAFGDAKYTNPGHDQQGTKPGTPATA